MLVVKILREGNDICNFMGRLFLLENVLLLIFRFKGGVDLKARQLIPMSLFWGVLFYKSIILSLQALHVPGTFQIEQTRNIWVLLLLKPVEVA